MSNAITRSGAQRPPLFRTPLPARGGSDARRDPDEAGSQIRSTPARALLIELLATTIVLQEDFDKLPGPAREAIEQCSETEDILARLVAYGLLTTYQADRVAAGTTYGLVLGNYRVLDRLGAGGMGVVFSAEHGDMRRPVAIKVLALHAESDAKIEQRFLMEIRVVAQLQHPNIVAAMDAGKISAPGSPCLRYFVMELVPGQDLEEYVNETGPVSPSLACDIIRQVTEALAEAHKHDLIHRDIKPANIRLTPDGQAKLLDFGLARQFDTRMTTPGTILGTVDFMAPEQTFDAAAVDIRADIYALGGTLFWCLTGRNPFLPQAHILQDLLSRRTAVAPSVRAWRPEISPELDAVVAKMMALEPRDRYTTPNEVLQALLPLGTGPNQLPGMIGFG